MHIADQVSHVPQHLELRGILHNVCHGPRPICVQGQVVFGLRTVEVMRTAMIVPLALPGIDGSCCGFGFGEERVECWICDGLTQTSMNPHIHMSNLLLLLVLDPMTKLALARAVRRVVFVIRGAIHHQLYVSPLWRRDRLPNRRLKSFPLVA